MRIGSHIFRRLLGSPMFTFSIIALLAIGIGASSAIFSIVDAILFRRLTVPHPESLVRVFGSDARGEDLSSSSSYPVYSDYVEQSNAFEGLAGYSDGMAMNLATGSELPRQIDGAAVTGNYFAVTGARPFRGRLIEGGDDRIGSGRPVVVLSHRFWRERFGSDPAAVGRTIRLNGHPFTIIGVAEPGFMGTDLESIPELYVPISLTPMTMPAFGGDDIFQNRRFSWMAIIGRLAPGKSLEQAQTQLRSIAARRAAAQPLKDRDPSATLIPAGRAALDLDNAGKTERISWFLLAFVLLVLLISSLDAGGLTLARVRRQQRDLAVRLAIGASTRSLIATLLEESLVLSIAGAACGFGVAAVLRRWLFAVAARELPFPIEAARSLDDARVVIFTSVIAVAVAVLMTLLPAWTALRTSVVDALKGGGDTPRLRRLRVRTGDLFVIGQIALSAAILVSMGLVLQTILNLNRVDPGFNPDHAFITSIDLTRQGYKKERGSEMLARIVEEVSALPGIDAAAFGRTVPLQQSGMRMTMTVRGHRPPVGSDDAGT